MVPSTTPRSTPAGNGVTTAFAITWPFQLDADVKVVLINDTTRVETPKSITTHYTLTGAGTDNGGTLTMLVAPAVGETLLIYLDPTVSQGSDYTDNQKRPGATLEASVDKLTMIVHRHAIQLSRALRLPEGFTAVIDMFLPKIVVNGAYLKYKADGSGFEAGKTEAELIAAANIGPQTFTVNRALQSGAGGVAEVSAVTATELGYLSGVTSAIQTQINALIAKALGTAKGAIIAFTASGTPAELAVGANGKVLRANSAQSTGLEYVFGQGDIQTKTANYTILPTDGLIKCSGAAFTATLPSAVGLGGKEVTIVKTDAVAANIITIDGDGTETINGAANTKLHTQNEAVTLVSDNVNWSIKNRLIPKIWSLFNPSTVGTQGLGTIAAESCFWMRDGIHMVLSGKMTLGTTTGVEARITLPYSALIDPTSTPTIRAAEGRWYRSITSATTNKAGTIVILGDNAYLNMSRDDYTGTGNPISQPAGDSLFAAGEVIAFTARIPIKGWEG